MKILQLMAGAPHGGAETAFVDMCLALKDAGQDLEVVTRRNPMRVPKLRAAGLKVHTLPFGGAIDFYTPYKIRGIIESFKPDIVQTWMSRAAQRLPVRSKNTLHPYKVVSRLGGYYPRKHFQHADYFTTITPDIRRHLMDQGVNPDYVRHINNFAETEDHAPPADRAALNTPRNVPVILALGRLHAAKAHDILIKAVAGLDGVYLWIAGEGPERPALEGIIKTLNVQDRVRLLGWRNDRAALFATADLCVFASRYEPFGTVFVQSWAQRVPVIVSDADGPRQFVKHEEDGLVVAREDIDSLQAAIKRLLGDTNLRARLIENGYARYQTEFTKDQCVKAYLEYYREILSPASP